MPRLLSPQEASQVTEFGFTGTSQTQPAVDTSTEFGFQGVLNKQEQERKQQESLIPKPISNEPTEKPWLKTLGLGLADIALQPARFLERTGKTIGTLGMTPEQKLKYEKFVGPGLQETVFGSEYATPAYEKPSEVAGGTLQAGANLATPLIGGLGKLALQGASISAGKKLEEGGTPGQAIMSGVVGGTLSAAGGKLLGTAGTMLSKGYNAVKQEAINALKPVAMKMAPMLTGLSKKEAQLAFSELAPQTAKNFEILRSATSPQEAESLLRRNLLDSIREKYSLAKEKVGQQFQSGLDMIKAQFPDAKGDIASIAKSLQEKLPKFGQPVSADETQALNAVLDTIRQPREYTIDGMRSLYDDLWSIASRTEQGTPARKAAMDAVNGVRSELSRVTNGKIDKVFEPYAAFKDDESLLKPVWGESVDENRARNFVTELSSAQKTASMDALQRMGKRAGIAKGATPESDVLAYNFAKRLAQDQKLTGNRMADILGAGLLYSGGGALGEFIGGEKGKTIGQVAGALAGGKLLAPAAISKVLLPVAEKEGIQITGQFRQFLGKLVDNPVTKQALMRMLQEHK